MPHSVAALVAALSGLGATAAHTKTEASLEACLLHAGVAGVGHGAANAATISAHGCAAPALLKVAGKTATDFVTGLFFGVKTVAAGSSTPVCISTATVGVPKAVGTSALGLKTSGASPAIQSVGLEHYAQSIGAGSANGSKLISDSFAAFRADGSARHFSDGFAAHTFTHALPAHSTAPAAGAAGSQATGVAAGSGGAPTAAGAVASASGVAMKTSFACKNATALSAQHKGVLLSKTAAHGGHHAWKNHSSFLGRKSKAGSSSRNIQQAQKQAAKDAKRQQKQAQREQRKQQKQLRSQQKKQQKQQEREQRAQQRARKRAYKQQRAQSREMYRQERDRLKQEQRQLRSLARNEERLQQERERLAQARAGGGGSSYQAPSRYGRGGSYGTGYGAPGGDSGWAGYGGRGYNYHSGGYGGRYGYHSGGYDGMGYNDYPGYYGRGYGEAGYPGGYNGGHGEYAGPYALGNGEGYAGGGSYEGGAGNVDHYESNGGGYAEEGYNDEEFPAGGGGVTHHVYAQPGSGEGLKSVTVVQDIAETKGGVTLHHVTETTSRGRDVLTPLLETQAACCFSMMQLTGARYPQQAGVAVKGTPTSSAREAAFLRRCSKKEVRAEDVVVALALTQSKLEAIGTADATPHLVYKVSVTEGSWTPQARTSAKPQIVVDEEYRETAASEDRAPAVTSRWWTGNGLMTLHSIREEDEEGEAEEEGSESAEGRKGDSEKVGEKTLIRIRNDPCALLTHSFRPFKTTLQSSQPLSKYYCAESQQQRQQQHQPLELQLQPHQLLRWKQEKLSQQATEESEGYLPRRSTTGGSCRLLCACSEDHPRIANVAAPLPETNEELYLRIPETGIASRNRAFLWVIYEDPQRTEAETTKLGMDCGRGNAAGFLVNFSQLCAAGTSNQMLSHKRAIMGIQPRTHETAATGSHIDTANFGERGLQAHQLWGTRDASAMIGCMRDVASCRTMLTSRTVTAAQPPPGSHSKDPVQVSHLERDIFLDEVDKGKQDHSGEHACCPDVCSTSRGRTCTAAGRSVEAGRSRETKVGRERILSLCVHRPHAEKCVTLAYSDGACVTAAGYYPHQVAALQSTLVSVATVAAHVSLPAPVLAFSGTGTRSNTKKVQDIPGRRVQLSFLPFRKLMYSNFF